MNYIYNVISAVMILSSYLGISQGVISGAAFLSLIPFGFGIGIAVWTLNARKMTSLAIYYLVICSILFLPGVLLFIWAYPAFVAAGALILPLFHNTKFNQEPPDLKSRPI